MEFFLPSGEKRAFPRTRLSLSCELVFAEDNQHVLGQCLDLSTTGAKVILSENIPTGVKAHLRLREHLGKEPFEATVEITRVERFFEEPAEERKGKIVSGLSQERYCAGLKIIQIL